MIPLNYPRCAVPPANNPANARGTANASKGDAHDERPKYPDRARRVALLGLDRRLLRRRAVAVDMEGDRIGGHAGANPTLSAARFERHRHRVLKPTAAEDIRCRTAPHFRHYAPLPRHLQRQVVDAQ